MRDIASVDIRKTPAPPLMSLIGVTTEMPVRRYASLAAMIFGLLGLPTAASLYTGSWWIPHNDDWAFTRVAEHFAKTAEVRLVGWNNGAVVGQAIVLGPLGANAYARHVLVLGLSVTLLCYCYAALHACVSHRLAMFGTATLALTPYFSLLATSFMTDIPAVATSIACVVLARRAWEAGSASTMVVALCVGFLGATVREVAIAAPLSVLIFCLLERRSNLQALIRTAWIAGAVLLSTFALFELWRRSLPFGMNPIPQFTVLKGLHFTVEGYFTVALFILPSVIVKLTALRWSPQAKFAAATTLCLGVFDWQWDGSVLLGNYLDPAGAYAAAGPGNRSVIPVWLYTSFSGLAIASGALLAARIIGVWSRVDRLWRISGVLAACAFVAPTMLGQGPLDRYLLPLLVPALIFALGPSAPNQEADSLSLMETPRLLRLVRITAACMLTAAFVLANVLSTTALSYDAARWHSAERLVGQGIPATDVSAGLEWSGMHSTLPAVQIPDVARAGQFWATQMFRDSRECYLVTAGVVPTAGRLVHVHSFRRYAFIGTEYVRTYEFAPCR